MRLRPRFFSGGRYRVLEPDEGKLSSPVLRGLEVSNGLRLLGKAIKRFEESRGNRMFCHLNPSEFFDHTGRAKLASRKVTLPETQQTLLAL